MPHDPDERAERLVEVADPAAVEALARLILDPAREVPVVALTSRRREREPAIDPDEVLAIVGPGMVVHYVPDGPFTRRLEELLPRRMHVFGGAARIWWPGVGADADPRAHPLVQDRYGVYGSQAVRELREHWAQGPPAAERTVDDAELVLVREERDHLRERSERLAAEVRTLMEQLAETRRRAEDAERRAREAARAERQEPGHEEPQPDADADFRLQVLREWLSIHRGGERDERPLARYRLGPEFLTTAGGLSAEVRPRIPWVCALVLSGRAHELGGLEVHRLRTATGGDAPQRTRRRDGAKAWRAAVKQSTPGAPRIHWWALPDGTVELASADHHDRFDIPE